MYFVYILRSRKESKRLYTGKALGLEERLGDQNRGDSAYARKFLPWVLETYICFKSKVLADKFEAYLKSGSGQRF